MATKGHRSATSDPATITAWWTLRPDALIGGRIPKDVVVLDIDPRHDGHDTWDTIVAGHDLPVTRVTLPAATTAVFTFGFGTPNGHRTQGP